MRGGAARLPLSYGELEAQGVLEAQDHIYLTALTLVHVFGRRCVMSAIFYLGAQFALPPSTPEAALKAIKPTGSRPLWAFR